MELFLTLEENAYQLLEMALEYIREAPLPDGDRIIAVDYPPMVIYHYRDENFRIAYGLSYIQSEDCYDIAIEAVDVL